MKDNSTWQFNSRDVSNWRRRAIL